MVKFKDYVKSGFNVLVNFLLFLVFCFKEKFFNYGYGLV